MAAQYPRDGGGGGAETDPVASPALTAHATAETSARASAITAAVAAHEADTSVHGIPDTTVLATDAEVTGAVAAETAARTAALAGKASATHAHAIADVTGLQTELDGKLEAETDPVASAALTAHAADTEAVHGIADTSVLVTDTELQAAFDALPSGSGGHLGDFSDIAAATVVSEGQTVTHRDITYARVATGARGATFRSGDWRKVAAHMLPVGHRPRVVTFKQDTRILDAAASTLGTRTVQPENVVRDFDGAHYCLTTFTTTGNVVTCGWLKCDAGDDPRDGSNWYELGAVNGLPLNTDGPIAFHEGAHWYVLAGSKTAGTGIKLYKATTLLGPYSLVAAGGAANDLIPVGATGAWDVSRVMEPEYFVRADGTRVILYMGFDTGSVHEQIGMATCPAASNFELAASWTKHAGNPIIPNGAAGSDDEQICADPYVIEVNGTAWICYIGAAAGGVTEAVVTPNMVATTTDWATFTKRGVIFEAHALWPVDDAPDTQNGMGRVGYNWRGHWFRLGPEYDYDVLWPYGNHYGSFNTTYRRVQARMAVAPLECFTQPPGRSNPWKRVQANTTTAAIVKTGASWGVSSNARFSGGSISFATTPGDKIRFYFEGSGIRVRGQSRVNLGMFHVDIDGVRVATDIDAYHADGASDYWSILMVDKDDLPAGPHYIDVIVSANKNAASTGLGFFVDYFEFLPSLGS